MNGQTATIRCGVAVKLKGYREPFIVAEVRAPEEASILVRSLDECGGDIATHYGNIQRNGRDAYLWFGTDISNVEEVLPQTEVPGVVARFIRSADSHGAYKKAIVFGKRFPVTAFHDPSWESFVDTVYRAGFIFSDETPCELGITTDGLDHGSYSLGEVRKQTRVSD